MSTHLVRSVVLVLLSLGWSALAVAESPTMSLPLGTLRVAQSTFAFKKQEPSTPSCTVSPETVQLGESFEVQGKKIGRNREVDVHVSIGNSWLMTRSLTTNRRGSFTFQQTAEASGDGIVNVVDAQSGDDISSCWFTTTGVTSCEPTTCGPDECGVINDGCGGTVDCGECNSCEPTTCGSDDCGVIDDGCGGTVDCGECPAPADRQQPPPDGTIDGAGRFRVSCDFSHRAQVDPIVSPFQKVAGHMHDFFGSTITSEDPSYSRMLNDSGSSCSFSQDTAAYWFPSLRAPDGSFVEPDEFLIYYRAKPEDYEHGTNYFPPDFKMIAGGPNAPDTAAYWTCEGESDTGYADRKTYIPNCTGVEDERLVAHVFFPSCWDGVNLDSADHRSHVAYGLDDGKVVSTHPETCPASHPYKIPQLDLRVFYPITDGRGYILSNGDSLPHSDFWNTWQQDALEELIDRCLRTGENCEGISD